MPLVADGTISDSFYRFLFDPTAAAGKTPSSVVNDLRKKAVASFKISIMRSSSAFFASAPGSGELTRSSRLPPPRLPLRTDEATCAASPRSFPTGRTRP